MIGESTRRKEFGRILWGADRLSNAPLSLLDLFELARLNFGQKHHLAGY
jgi:hypothetical protein